MVDTPRPFVKWVGGKNSITEVLLQHVPENFGCYHEPMAGGGALFWALVRDGRLPGLRSILSDTNAPLMETYRAVRDDVESLIKSLEVFKQAYEEDPEALYYRIRDAWNEGYRSPARFIFLKQTGFNGLWRYNRKGQINMSWGKYKAPRILDVKNLIACSQGLRNTLLSTESFSMTEEIKAGDAVYYDPPYLGTFDLYDPEGFTLGMHVTLLKRCASLCERGATVLYTNQDSPEMRALLDEHWPNARVRFVGVRRTVNCDGEGREPVQDMVVYGPAPKRRGYPQNKI